ncbi:MAG TPA: cupin domain-containing protein [Spirochaetota bacterium]|nr:cupin domain-containing protein [Spirochaetota bacterium]HOH37401.1 cupin domain-containing protein [Spirochaetota bacterium]HPJ13817.1 cupin domain-containing protein [Spirochaetota bacterium]HPM33006.1 cupin domain-containing protein [Spirochaetota bacterium]HPY03296.1 cupin domain-containing protein [Spirochaetota bacterium]
MENDTKNIYDILEDASEDKFTGVKLIRISCSESVSLFAAELASEAVLKAHYHLKGDETYFVIEGSCSIKLSRIDDTSSNTDRIINLVKGDIITVKEKMIHSLRNSKCLSRIIIACPEEHAGSDRFFMEDFDEKM